MLNLAIADRRWNGCRVVVAASGPSLSAQVAAVCDGEIVLAVNDAYKLFPNAAVLYACDAVWWEVNNFVPEFSGERWTSHSTSPRNDKTGLKNRELFHIIGGRTQSGFSTDPGFVSYGNNSGFQAVNLAILFGATEIVLIGFDMRVVGEKSHFFGNHKVPLRAANSYLTWINEFANAGKMLDKRIQITNATPNSALKCFPMIPLEEALRSGGGFVHVEAAE